MFFSVIKTMNPNVFFKITRSIYILYLILIDEKDIEDYLNLGDIPLVNVQMETKEGMIKLRGSLNLNSCFVMFLSQTK